MVPNLLETASQYTARLEAENERLRAAFRVNTLRWQPKLSHAEIDAEIERIVRGDVQTHEQTASKEKA